MTMTDMRVLWPGNRLPVTVLLDDPTPCRNPMWYEYPNDGHEAVIPLGFTERFAAMIERTGAAGKFSVVPCPGAQGRIDEGMPGIAADEMEAFVRLVRERIAPRWDIGPEMLTHNSAIDLATGAILPEREDAWARRQDEATLTRYIAHALQILRNVGLQPNGVTSPWSFGAEVEDAYAGAIATALREVCGVHVGWYFLHSDTQSRYVAPRTMRLDPADATALVSLVSGQRDCLWRTQYGEPAEIDSVLAADGSTGRLADLFAAGSPIVFTTHWQSLFSNGSGAGLLALEELCQRINRAWGRRIRWTSARELAVYCAARDTFRATMSDDGRSVRITTAIGSPDFTFTLPIPPGATELYADGVRLERCPDNQTAVDEGCWSHLGDRALVSLRLHESVELSYSLRPSMRD